MLSELLNVKIEESKFNQILNWISIGIQFSAMCPSKFFIFVASELLGAKIEKFKTNYILNHIYTYIYIYIYNEKPLHILEMYGF